MGNLYRKLRAVIHEAAKTMKRKRRPRKVARLAIRASALLLLATSAGAITNGTAPATDDWRFDAVGDFGVSWRLGFDQGSHADDADNAGFCSATLVNAEQIEVGRHCLDSYGLSATYMVRFRRRDDGGLGSVVDGVASFFHVRIASWSYVATAQNEDIAIGLLDTPVYHITAIPLSAETVTVNEPFIQAGWGREGLGSNIGPNGRLLLCGNHVHSTVLSGAWITHPSPDIPDYGYNPCGPNSWDSGGPDIALDACGNPRVIASHVSALAGVLMTEASAEAAPPDVFYRCSLMLKASASAARKAAR